MPKLIKIIEEKPQQINLAIENKYKQFFTIKSKKKVFPAYIHVNSIAQTLHQELVVYVSRREQYPSEKCYELKFRKKS